ncbi:hypothetical protein [Marivita sp.]|uniref:hypothetical protein n=1 Tax=Marivita sp. TaxID=2003365 RepID=UPI0025C4603B|nr:hypothetical protein [Marivita sp.]
MGDLPTLRDRPMDWSRCTEAFHTDLSRVVELAIRGARERDRFGGRLGRDPVAERRRATRRSPGSPGTPSRIGQRSTPSVASRTC